MMHLELQLNEKKTQWSSDKTDEMVISSRIGYD